MSGKELAENIARELEQDEGEQNCLNCGNFTGGASECTNCGAILYNEDEEMNDGNSAFDDFEDEY